MMNFGQQGAAVGGPNLGVVQPQQKLQFQNQPSSGGAFSFQLGTGTSQLGSGGGLTLGQGTQASGGVNLGQAGALPGQVTAQTGQLQLGGLQTGGLLGQQKLGQTSGLQAGAQQLGGLQAGAQQLGGLQAGSQQLGGLQAGGQQLGGLQAGKLQSSQATGLQLGGLQTGVQLGQVSKPGGLQLQTGGLQQLGQTTQPTGVQLVQASRPGGLQLGGLQAGGLQLGQTTQPTGLQLGQASRPGGLQLGGLQAGGLQLGQTTQPTGLQLGQALQTAAQANGLQLGQTTKPVGLQLGQTSQATGLQLGQTQTGQTVQGGGLQLQTQLGQAKQLPGQAGGLQLGQMGTLQQTSQGGGLQIGKPGQLQTTGLQTGGLSQSLKLPQQTATVSALGTTTSTLGLQTTKPGLSLTQTVAPLLHQTTTAAVAPANGALKLGGGLPGPPSLKLGASTGGGLQLGTTTTASTGGGTLTTGQGLGLGGLQTGLQAGVQATTAVSLGATATTSSTFKGLGGVDPSSATGKGTDKDDSASIVDTSLPDLLVQLVEGFKKFLKLQKETSDEISKFSDTSLRQVQKDIGTHTQVLAVASAQIKKDVQTVSFLGQETSEELRNAEVAQRTRELPAWLQKENTAPDQYFQRLVSSFEAKMELYRRQIEELESHLSAISPETGISPQTVIEILQLQYKPFLLLAAQLQATHEHVQILKEQYLSYRKVFLQDSTDVFDEKRKKAKLSGGGSEVVQTGPSPFSNQMGHTTAGLANLTTKTSTGTSLQGVGLGRLNNGSLGVRLGGLGTGLGGGLGATTGALGQGLSLGSSVSQPSLGTAPVTNPVTQKPFQLMKPPLGKRRNA